MPQEMHVWCLNIYHLCWLICSLKYFTDIMWHVCEGYTINVKYLLAVLKLVSAIYFRHILTWKIEIRIDNIRNSRWKWGGLTISVSWPLFLYLSQFREKNQLCSFFLSNKQTQRKKSHRTHKFRKNSNFSAYFSGKALLVMMFGGWNFRRTCLQQLPGLFPLLSKAILHCKLFC